MKSRTGTRIIIFALINLLLLAVNAYAQTPDPDDIVMPDNWVGTYTPEEIAAIERSLWAANLTLEDLNFRKDFTYGYECFPIVREWLEHPMEIAPDVDGMIEGFKEDVDLLPSPIAELVASLIYFPEFDSEEFSELEQLLNIQFSDNAIFGVMTIEELEDYFRNFLDVTVYPDFFTPNGNDLKIIRQFCPSYLSWHDVFESPFSDEEVEEWEVWMEEQNDEYLYELMSEIYLWTLVVKYNFLCPYASGFFKDLPVQEFPLANKIIIETENGRIGIGSRMSDYWTGDFTVLIDPGGNDTYHNCRIGAAYGTEGNSYGYFVDLGGDDFYDCGDVDITLGAAVLGVAAFYDLGQGNDRYIGGSCTLGAAMCGVATFYDDGGSDTYESKVYSQGAAGFGIGIMVDDSVQDPPELSTDEGTPDPVDIAAFDNDHYYAWTNSQAFARTKGFAICSNRRGNDVYEAGGVYLHAPLFADRYQSFSQGFAIGERGIDYAGGIALIIDYDGNDRYLGDVYNQGVGYWYSAGLMYDGGGNDTYEMTQYGQGSGIHLAVGGLIDVSGNDSYTMHTGLGTGGSHDYAVSVLHDRGGNDQYFGNTSCNGGSLTNSAVIFIDRAGNDTYAGRRDGGINFGRPARGFTSIGILVDLDGQDDYLGIMDNDMLWTQDQVGVGWDTVPPPIPEGEEPAEPESDRGGLGEDVPLPEIISFEGDLTQEVFDELWEISVRWEVGDNRFIVPHARDRLIAFGPDVLPFLSEKFDNMNSGLAIRAFDVILGAFIESDKDGVIEIILENLESDVEMRRRIALAEITTLKLTELELNVAEILDDPDPNMQRRAIGVLGALESHIADTQLLENLSVMDDEALIKVSMETLFSLDVYCYNQLRFLLDHPYISVRDTLIGLLAAHSNIYTHTEESEDFHNAVAYSTDLYEELYWESGQSYIAYIMPDLSTRALRSVLKIFATGTLPPDSRAVTAISILLENEDWGVRADAVKVVHRWLELSIEPEPVEETVEGEIDGEVPVEEPLLELDYDEISDLIEPLLDQLEEMKDTETDPYVLFVLDENQ